jgi:hypothetical protein
VNHAAFSPGGRRLVTASHDGTARVWEVPSGKALTSPLKHKGRVFHAAFSPGGRRLVIASLDGTARVWDAASGQPLTPPLRHQGGVAKAAFSPDGRRLVTASYDKTARVWDAASGQPLSPPLKHQGPVLHAAFSPDGRRLVTASGDKTARVWDLFPDNRPAEDWILLAELMAGHRLDRHGALIPLSPDEVRKGFAKLRAKYPQDFTVRPADALAWHRQEFQACRNEKNGPAALFHYVHGHLDWTLLTCRPLR